MPALPTAFSLPPSALPRRRRRAVQKPVWLQHPFQDGPIDVSVCIANWNCRELLRDCLESLCDQPQGVRLEVIVVDNGSTDGAPDLVAREFPEVILCRNPENRGFARANNQAAERARGQYLFFLNNDTVVPPGALGRLVDYALANPQAGLIGPRLVDTKGQPQVSYRQRPTLAALLHRTYLLRWTGLLRGPYRRYRREKFDPNRQRPVEVLMGAAMLMPRAVFARCGRWDEDFVFGGEDVELSVRVGREHPVIFLPSVTVIHHGRVSTRQNIGDSSTNVTTGLAHYLRTAGYSPALLVLYKLVVTLDAPLHIAAKALEYLWRRWHGEHEKAQKSLLALSAARFFLFQGLRRFWQA